MAKPTAKPAETEVFEEKQTPNQTTAVAPVAAQGLPSAMAEQFQKDSGAGNENVGRTDIIPPFYKILDSQSAEVKRTKSQYIDGAEEGMILNTVTKELIPGNVGILVIPAYYELFELEWRPIDVGGLVAIHPRDTPLTKQTTKGGPTGNQNILPNGNLLSTTAQHYIVRVHENGFEMGIISMASTRLKKNRLWNSLIEGIQLTGADGKKFQPPRFSHMWRLKTAPESKGTQSWWTWDIEPAGMVTDGELYKVARQLFLDIKSGVVKADVVDTGEPGAGPVVKSDDDIPF